MTGDDLMRWLSEASSLGAVLRRVRNNANMPQSEAAEYAGLAKSYISMIESDAKMPQRDALIALLLGGYSLPARQAGLILLFAGYAPLHHRGLLRT